MTTSQQFFFSNRHHPNKKICALPLLLQYTGCSVFSLPYSKMMMPSLSSSCPMSSNNDTTCSGLQSASEKRLTSSCVQHHRHRRRGSTCLQQWMCMMLSLIVVIHTGNRRRRPMAMVDAFQSVIHPSTTKLRSAAAPALLLRRVPSTVWIRRKAPHAVGRTMTTSTTSTQLPLVRPTSSVSSSVSMETTHGRWHGRKRDTLLRYVVFVVLSLLPQTFHRTELKLWLSSLVAFVSCLDLSSKSNIRHHRRLCCGHCHHPYKHGALGHCYLYVPPMMRTMNLHPYHSTTPRQDTVIIT